MRGHEGERSTARLRHEERLGVGHLGGAQLTLQRQVHRLAKAAHDALLSGGRVAAAWVVVVVDARAEQQLVRRRVTVVVADPTL